MFLTLPNFITLLRIPLAFVFLQDNVMWRGLALVIAMLTDCFDGQIARRYNKISRFGTFLDPMADKFFVFFILTIFIQEHKIHPIEAIAMLGRDFAVIIFGIYLAFRGTLRQYQFRAIWCGKIATTLQFIVLLALSFDFSIPSSVYVSFVILGLAALVELYLERAKLKVE